MKKYEKLYPQLVEVVNELKAKIDSSESNPLFVTYPSSLIGGTGSNASLKVFPTNTSVWVFSRPNTGYYNVCVSALYVQDSQTGFVTVVPLNQTYYNLTTAKIELLEQSFHTFNLLYPATSPSKVVYSKLDNQGNVTQVVYSLQ